MDSSYALAHECRIVNVLLPMVLFELKKNISQDPPCGIDIVKRIIALIRVAWLTPIMLYDNNRLYLLIS